MAIPLPNFLICGAPKAGTTSLYHHLARHPDVLMSVPKETWFFYNGTEYEKGVDWYSRTFFESHNGESAVGEATTGYMASAQAPARIARHLPHARLVFILRNPIERAYSHYWFHALRGTFSPSISFSEAIRDPELHDGRCWKMIRTGRYYDHLTRYERFFDRSQMMVLLYRRFRSVPEQVVREVYEFIGVDPTFTPDTSKRHNATRYPKNRRLYQLASFAWEPVKKALGPALSQKTRWLRRTVRNRLLQSGEAGEKPPMRPEDRAYLRRIYREPNRRLVGYLGRDLSHWR